MTALDLGIWKICLIFLFTTPWTPPDYFETRVMHCRECSDMVVLFRALGRPAWGECYR